jgi:hypothetical protein
LLRQVMLSRMNGRYVGGGSTGGAGVTAHGGPTPMANSPFQPPPPGRGGGGGGGKH